MQSQHLERVVFVVGNRHCGESTQLRSMFKDVRLGREGAETVQVLGCPRCRKNLATIEQYNEHLNNDVLPPIVELVLTLGN
jgi:hypothetical protein